MLTYEKLSRRPLIFRSFTGLEVSEFDSIYEEVESKHDDYERKRLYKEDRKRKVGAGRPFKLDLQARFLMLLVYYRLYITSTLAGFLFDLDQSNVLKDIRKLEPLVKECIPIPKKLYDRAKRARTLEEIEEYFHALKPSWMSLNRRYPDPKTRKNGEPITQGRKRGTP